MKPKSKSKDIFANECKNPILWLLIILVVGAGFFSFEIQQVVDLLFFFAIGGLCLYNYKRCGRIHCWITGYGFTLVGIAALLRILGLLNFKYSRLWLLFVFFLVTGYGVEFLHRHRSGTKHKK